MSIRKAFKNAEIYTFFWKAGAITFWLLIFTTLFKLIGKI